MRTAGSFWRACIFVLVSTMKVIKVFFLFILLGGDYGLELASLEAFPTQAYRVDGRANLLFAPVSPFLLSRPCFTGGTVFLAVTVFLLGKIAWDLGDLGQPIYTGVCKPWTGLLDWNAGLE